MPRPRFRNILRSFTIIIVSDVIRAMATNRLQCLQKPSDIRGPLETRVSIIGSAPRKRPSLLERTPDRHVLSIIRRCAIFETLVDV
jgi:hypothetical protein